jgi:polyisoprenyl-phosphate glycosyltransferase
MQLSVVIPVFNEEKNVNELYKQLSPVLKRITRSYEIIFVNDGSSDQTLQLIKLLRRKDKRIKTIHFSRNFGHMSAINAGLLASSGKKVVLMDADLQDPPKVIVKMYQKSIHGYDVVYGIKKRRKENIVLRIGFLLFYRILNSISNYKMPLDAGTFSILDRRVVDILIKLPEKNKYFSGLRAWTGFSQIGVEYERAARYAGKPASLRRLLRLALDGIFSFSYIPLRLASIFGFICALIALAGVFVVIIARIFFGAGFVGWASTMITILLMSGVQLITLGIIGEYLGRIYDEVKNRPEYIIEEKIGFTSSRSKKQ